MNSPGKLQERGFTLLELLLTVSIITVLVVMMMPTLNRGHVKVKQIRCTSNLRQVGAGMLSFATAHDDKFPVQLSTNNGGSAEFLQAGYAVRGEFFFGYKHLQPLASEIADPRVLVCPADSRTAASNFSELRNTNLSYFVSGKPEFAKPESLLSGDRNLTPVLNSLAHLGGAQVLRWTHELHQYKGNLLFGDGHVELSQGGVGRTNSGSAPVVALVMPTVAGPRIPGGQGPTPVYSAGPSPSATATPGGSLALVNLSSNSPAGSNMTVTNLSITSGPRGIPEAAFIGISRGSGASPETLERHDAQTPLKENIARSSAAPITPIEGYEQNTNNPKLSNPSTGVLMISVPWWVAAAVLAGLMFLLYVVGRAALKRKTPPQTSDREFAPWKQERG